MSRFEVIRDPLWDNITLDAAGLALLDTAAVQRLRYVRQLGHAFLVYPGATHSRFEHALGAYHLTRRALQALEARGELSWVTPADRLAVTSAALLHDIGHYPFSHALEEAGFLSHEVRGVARLAEGELGERLTALGGPGLIEAIGDLMRGRSPSPLAGLISGSLDLDKIDYLCRDSRMCGVPYGLIDVDRLLASLTLVDTGAAYRQVGVHEKGASALESLLFAKYQMYRNVYWHHAVRSATCMFKRAARLAVRTGRLTVAAIAELTDDALMQILAPDDPLSLAAALRNRRLYKRALDLPASEVADPAPWIAEDPDLTERVEDALAAEVGLAPGELLLDFPARADLLAVNLPLLRRDGSVELLTSEGREGHVGLPRIAEELYRSARRLRVFVARPPQRPIRDVAELVRMPREAVLAWVSGR
jgi:HD superfamily phosphohydrolase